MFDSEAETAKKLTSLLVNEHKYELHEIVWYLLSRQHFKAERMLWEVAELHCLAVDGVLLNDTSTWEKGETLVRETQNKEGFYTE